MNKNIKCFFCKGENGKPTWEWGDKEIPPCEFCFNLLSDEIGYKTIDLKMLRLAEEYKI